MNVTNSIILVLWKSRPTWNKHWNTLDNVMFRITHVMFSIYFHKVKFFIHLRSLCHFLLHNHNFCYNMYTDWMRCVNLYIFKACRDCWPNSDDLGFSFRTASLSSWLYVRNDLTFHLLLRTTTPRPNMYFRMWIEQQLAWYTFCVWKRLNTR